MRDRWIAWVLAHSRLILVIAALLTAVMGGLAARLRVDNDLRTLLPRDHPVLASLERVEGSFSGVGSVDLVLRGGTPEARRALADALAPKLAALPEIEDVEHRIRGEFFVDHALYYLDDDALARLVDLVDGWAHHELCGAQPGLCLDPPDPDAPGRLRAFVRAQQETARAKAPFADYYEREGVDALVMLLHPTRPSSDLEFSRRVTDAVRSLAHEVSEEPGSKWREAGVEWAAIGPYVVKADEHRTIRRDIWRSGLFAVAGVCLVLALLFRSGRALLSLVIPLLCGVTWAMGATQLALGHLNTLTSLISTVIMGMGIDAGIHILLRARRERLTHDDDAAIQRAFSELFTPLLIASGTTLGAFVVMASSSFPAFREFGVIAVLGVSLCLLAMITVFPALLSLIGVKPARPPAHRRGYGRLVAALVRRPGAALLVVLGISVAAVGPASRVAFERNGRMLQAEDTRARTSEFRALVNAVFAKEIHAGVLVVDSRADAAVVLAKARARRDALGDASRVAELLAAPDLLPAPELDLAARAKAIAALAEDVPESAWARLEEGADEDGARDSADALTPIEARRLRRMLDASPPRVDALPAPLRARLVHERDDGGCDFAVYAHPSFDAADILAGVAFSEEAASYTEGVTDRVFVGETTVYAAMYLMMRRDAPRVLAAAALLVAALVFLQLRSLPRTILTVLPLLLGLYWLLAAMTVTDVRFTLFNVPILPAILGIGVDNGVYLSDRIGRLAGREGGVAVGLQETGAAILAATTTTAIGFASFIVADSGGLAGIGQLAVLGIVIAAIAAILVVPTASALLLRRSR
ncbi:MAG: MMPL family transporter [Nannocystaceae bacterium]